MSLMKYGKYAVKKYPAVSKRARVYIPAVKQLASDVMYLKGIINSEPQNFSVRNQSNFDWNGIVVSLCDVPAGSGAGNRIGERILPKHMLIRAHVNKDTAGRAHLTIRYMIFRWWGETPNALGIAPTAAEVLEQVGTTYAPTSPLSNSVIGPKGDRGRRIEVHRTGMLTMDNTTKTSLDIEENISLNGKGKNYKEHMEYYSGGTAPPTSGGFFILFISDWNIAGEAQATVYSRLQYYDN